MNVLGIDWTHVHTLTAALAPWALREFHRWRKRVDRKKAVAEERKAFLEYVRNEMKPLVERVDAIEADVREVKKTVAALTPLKTA